MERRIRRGFSARAPFKHGVKNSNPSYKSNRLVLNESAARLGVSLRQTEDQLTRDMLASTASFINSVGGFDGDNPTEITRSDVDTVVRALLNNNAYTIMDNIEGEDKFGTAPRMNGRYKLSLIDLEAQA